MSINNLATNITSPSLYDFNLKSIIPKPRCCDCRCCKDKESQDMCPKKNCSLSFSKFVAPLHQVGIPVKEFYKRPIEKSVSIPESTCACSGLRYGVFTE